MESYFDVGKNLHYYQYGHFGKESNKKNLTFKNFVFFVALARHNLVPDEFDRQY